MNRPGIAQLQRWMNDVITTQGHMQHKLRRAEHLHGLHEASVIAETRDVSIYARMNVYTSGYVMRLFECLSADFPVLQKFMGEEVFDHFAKASLVWSPSTSYSLYDLGDTFIRFLEATRPAHLAPDDPEAVFLELPIEIARAERARQEAIRAKGLEGAELAEMFPVDILFGTHGFTLSAPPCRRLLELKFPVKYMLDGLYEDTPYETPEPKQTFLAVSRMSYRPTMEELEPWQYYFLSACSQPTTLTEAINRTAEITGISAATILADLCVWLQVFRDKGFVVVETG